MEHLWCLVRSYGLLSRWLFARFLPILALQGWLGRIRDLFVGWTCGMPPFVYCSENAKFCLEREVYKYYFSIYIGVIYIYLECYLLCLYN